MKEGESGEDQQIAGSENHRETNGGRENRRQRSSTNGAQAAWSGRVARWFMYFKTKKSQFGYILEGLGIENVGKFTAVWFNFLSFGTICGRLIRLLNLSHFLDQEKSGNPVFLWYRLRPRNYGSRDRIPLG
jgi:hypothetical protein